jgi:hypothetical protein
VINRPSQLSAEPEVGAAPTTVTRRCTAPRERKIEQRRTAGPADISRHEDLDDRLLDIRRRLLNGDYDTPQVLAVVAERLIASGAL